MTPEQSKDLEFYKNLLITEIKKIETNSDKFKGHLPQDVLMSIIYMKISSAYLQEKKFENIEQAWTFVNDMRGIIDKISYVSNYLNRIEDNLKASKNV